MKNAKSIKVADPKLVDLAKSKYAEFGQNMAQTIRFFLAKGIDKAEIARALTAGTKKRVIYQWVRNVSLSPIKK